MTNAPTPLIEEVERKHAIAWAGLNAPLDRERDRATRLREAGQKLERELAECREKLRIATETSHYAQRELTKAEARAAELEKVFKRATGYSFNEYAEMIAEVERDD